MSTYTQTPTDKSSGHTIPLSFDIELIGSPLTVIVSVDGREVFNKLVDQKTLVNIEFDDRGTEHNLCLTLQGKLPEHTKIDANGNIVEDSYVLFSNFVADGIDFSKVFFEKSTYKHNFNGHGAEVTEQFHGSMGCNGSATLTFFSPFYIWLLENM